jgi:hypothetical protein
MAIETTEQIIREDPNIEAYKLGLLEAARQQIAKPLPVPAYQVAGMTPEQVTAAQLAVKGIGAYAPFMAQGTQAITGGIGALGYGTQMAAQMPQYAQAAAAGLPAVQQGAGMVSQAANLTQGVRPEFAPAQQAVQGALGTTGLGIMGLLGGAQGYNPYMAQAYMNPYQQGVTQEALREMRRQADIAAQGQAAQAVRTGAFGGTREGVQRAEMERNVQDIMSQRIAQDLAQNYAQAQQAAMQGFETQQQRQLAASQGLTQAAGMQGNLGGQLGSLEAQRAQLGLTQAGQLGSLGAQQAQLGLLPAQIAAQQANIMGQGAQLYGQLGTGLGQLGTQQAALGEAATRLGQADVQQLFNLGEQQRQVQQQALEAQRVTALQAAMTPYQQLSFLSDIYKGAPSSQMALTGTSAPSTSPLVQAAGLGISGLAAASGASRAGLFG